jgi:diaminopimelate decarboxylase
VTDSCTRDGRRRNATKLEAEAMCSDAQWWVSRMAEEPRNTMQTTQGRGVRRSAAEADPGTAAAWRREAAVREAARRGLVDEDSPVVGFVDLAGIAAAQRALHEAFAEAQDKAPVLHAFAAKAASLVPLLRLHADAGMGCEVASPGELAQALAAGFPPERIVLDAPVKTRPELRTALRLGVSVNADNFDELARIDEILRGTGRDRAAAAGRPPLGLRVNPQVGAGSIGAMSTASEYSKFGVPLHAAGVRAQIVEAFRAYPWLDRLHLHVGSQGCPLELIARGVREVYELAEEINEALAAESGGRRRVTGVDLGGGLPVNFEDDRITPTFAEYVDVLRAAAPGLFDGRYALVTEFGRSLSAKNGFMLARVEYAKEIEGRRIALTHAGAQVATRTVFMPEAWPLRLGAYDAQGRAKHAPDCVQDVAGPCCFAGDLLAAERKMTALDAGDLVLLHDTGGYYFTATWTYNSLPRPAVYAFEVAEDGDVRFVLLRPQQTLEELVAEAGGAYADALATGI